MYRPRILIVENEDNWQDAFLKLLHPITTEVIQVKSEIAAREKFNHLSFDLAIFDLELAVENPSHSQATTNPESLEGENLIREIRHIPKNQYCGIIVVSGYVTDKNTDSLKDFGLVKVIGKSRFIPEEFMQSVQKLICSSLLAKAEHQHRQLKRLTISFGDNRIRSVRLLASGRKDILVEGANSIPFNVDDLIVRANSIERAVMELDPDVWKPQVASIGQAIYEKIKSHPDAGTSFTIAPALPGKADDVWLEFVGDSMGLGIPFELMQNENNNSLALRHIITRQISGHTSKPEPFHYFIRDLIKSENYFSMLLVGSDGNGDLPAVEDEVKALEKQIKASLDLLGVKHHFKCISGEEATFENVQRELRESDYHIFHYAGHSFHVDTKPEESGIILKEGNKWRAMTTHELESIARDKNLRLVYLSSCRGARSSDKGYGSFHGLFDALTKAGVPVVLGFRWQVKDKDAKEFAEVFYQHLLRTFSPGNAILEARKNAHSKPQGHNHHAWLSPILLMQSD